MKNVQFLHFAVQKVVKTVYHVDQEVMEIPQDWRNVLYANQDIFQIKMDLRDVKNVRLAIFNENQIRLYVFLVRLEIIATP